MSNADTVTYEKAEYQGREVELDKPFRTPDGPKKFAVYVMDGDSVKRVTFGDPDMEIRRDDPEARANFRARHNCDEKTDKTTPGYWSCALWSDESVSDILAKDEDGFKIEAEIEKRDDEKRIVYAWANVVEKDGKAVIDHHGDVITEEELVKAAHGFMRNSREAGEMHLRKTGVGELVESIVYTKDLQESLGIDLGKVGWFVGFKVTDDKVWKRIKSGDYSMMSIGGKGKRR